MENDVSGEPPTALRGLAIDEHAGRPCPYCRFALKAGVDIVQCGACGSVHHADCWDDNGGCSIVACAGGPGEGSTTGQIAAVAAPPAPPPPPRGAPVTASGPAVYPPPAPSSGNVKRGGAVLIGAILALALAISGVAVALVVTKEKPAATASTGGGAAAEGGDEPSELPPLPADETPDPEPVDTPEAIDTPEPEPEPESALPDVSRSQMRAEIKDMLRTWHQNIVDGDAQAAWDMLTGRKQTQNMRKYGFDEWAKGQASLAPYLDPSGLRVSIQDLDADTGVARVKVGGMTWHKSGASCREWSGITWVRYEDGMWRYDPGYSTTPQRERAWKNRVRELLGGSC